MISIHALREEGDFQRNQLFRRQHISIHALREEGDALVLFTMLVRVDFYPRPPRGGRPWQLSTLSISQCPFLSTPSARRATGRGRGDGDVPAISIHALREEGDAPLGCDP